MLGTICYSVRPGRSPASAQSAVKSTILAAWSTRARSSGEIVPRATIPSSVPSVFLITKSGIGAILRASLFFEKICKTSRIVDRFRERVIGLGLPARNGRGVDCLQCNLVDYLADCRQLGIIDRLGSIVGRMITRILTGREEQERNAAASERAVIAAVENQEIRAEQSDLQRAIARGLNDPGSESGAVFRTHHEDVRFADPGQRPADHVGGDEQNDSVKRDGRMSHEIARSEQADLLEVEADEHDASLGRSRP